MLVKDAEILVPELVGGQSEIGGLTMLSHIIYANVVITGKPS